MIKTIIDYLLNNDLAEIPKSRKNNYIKQTIIDGRTFRYNKAKEI